MCLNRGPDQRRERVIVAAFADALPRFKRKDKLADLPFLVANAETLSQRGVLDRVWAPLPSSIAVSQSWNCRQRREWTMTYRSASDVVSPRMHWRGSCRCRVGLAFLLGIRQAGRRGGTTR